MGLLAAQLVATVCKISSQRIDGDNREFDFILNQIEGKLIPELKALFQQDADDFDKVIQMRIKCDQETDPILRRRLREQSLRLLQGSTDIMFVIARRCLSLVDFSLIVFDGGAKRVRGDSGAAISSAIAGAMSALFIINLNLRSFQGGLWARRKFIEADTLQADIIGKQEDAFSRIVTLKPEQVNDIQPSFL